MFAAMTVEEPITLPPPFGWLYIVTVTGRDVVLPFFMVKFAEYASCELETEKLKV